MEWLKTLICKIRHPDPGVSPTDYSHIWKCKKCGAKRLVGFPVKKRPLRVDKMWPRKSSFIQRIAARIIANMFLEYPSHTWQSFGEKDGVLDSETMASIDLQHVSIAQMVLREVGYSVSEADLWKVDTSKAQRVQAQRVT